MDAIILVGGKGTRLQSVVKDVPKPMAPVNGHPFLEYLLKWVTSCPVKQIILSTGYKAELIENYFGGIYNGVPIKYLREETPLGTGGAIINALKGVRGNHATIINGDSYFPIDLRRFLDFHIENQAEISIALKRMKDFDRYGTVVLNGNDVISFQEKSYKESGLINAGIYCVAKNSFISSNYPNQFSFEKEILEKANLLKGFEFDEPFIDIGVPEDYERVKSMLS